MDEETQSQGTENLETQEAEGQASAEGEKDWEAEAKKFKAIAERKTKQLEKVTSSLKEEEKPNKPNTQSGLSEDRLYAKMYAKGYEDDEIDMAFKIAKLNNIPLDEALKDDYLLAKVEGRKQKELSKRAQLGPAQGGSPINQEIPSDRAEHQKVYEETMRKAGLR